MWEDAARDKLILNKLSRISFFRVRGSSTNAETAKCCFQGAGAGDLRGLLRVGDHDVLGNIHNLPRLWKRGAKPLEYVTSSHLGCFRELLWQSFHSVFFIATTVNEKGRTVLTMKMLFEHV